MSFRKPLNKLVQPTAGAASARQGVPKNMNYRYAAIALLCMGGSGCDVAQPRAESSVFWKLSPGQHLMYRFTRTQFDPSDKEHVERDPPQVSFVVSMIVTRRLSDTSYECELSIKDFVSVPGTTKNNETAPPKGAAVIKFPDCYKTNMPGHHKVILSASGQIKVESLSKALNECLEKAFTAVGMKFDTAMIDSTVNMMLPEVPEGPVILGQTWSSAASLPYTIGKVHMKRSYVLESSDVDSHSIKVNGSASMDMLDQDDKDCYMSIVVSGKSTFDARRKILTKCQVEVSSQFKVRDWQKKLQEGQGDTVHVLELLPP